MLSQWVVLWNGPLYHKKKRQKKNYKNILDIFQKLFWFFHLRQTYYIEFWITCVHWKNGHINNTYTISLLACIVYTAVYCMLSLWCYWALSSKYTCKYLKQNKILEKINKILVQITFWKWKYLDLVENEIEEKAGPIFLSQ